MLLMCDGVVIVVRHLFTFNIKT